MRHGILYCEQIWPHLVIMKNGLEDLDSYIFFCHFFFSFSANQVKIRHILISIMELLDYSILINFQFSSTSKGRKRFLNLLQYNVLFSKMFSYIDGQVIMYSRIFLHFLRLYNCCSRLDKSTHKEYI